jgi:sulfoxide reductase heme-binding subunit YedZ
VHLTSSPAIWYAARASGVVAYVVLTVTVSFGITMGGKAQSKRWPRFAVEDVHRFGGLLVGSLIGLHVLTIAADSFMPFSIGQLVIPFTSAYRPLSTGLGICAAELLLALAITNHYRKRLPYRIWRNAHYLNFAVWSLASVHGIFSGTDRSTVWLAAIYAVATGGVGALLAWRVGGRRVRTAGALTAVAVPALLLGPLQSAQRPWNAANVSERLTGQVVRNGTDVEQIVSFVGSAQSPQKLLVRADLLANPQRIDATSLQIEYLPSGDICRGQVTSVGGTSFAGSCSLANGQSRSVDASWVATPGEASGTIRLANP